MNLKIIFVLINAIIQGLTEFFPVSSSGHLMILQHFFKNTFYNNMALDVILNIGTLLAVVFFYRKVVFRLFIAALDLPRSIITKKEPKDIYYKRLLLLLAVSSVPLIIPFFLRKHYTDIIKTGNMLNLGVSFILTSIVLFMSRKRVGGGKSAIDMTYADALLIGLLQAVVAPVPGISRSGLTIAVGLLLGLSLKYCVMYSFLIGIPASVGAGILGFVDVFLQFNSLDWWIFLLGIIVSAIIGYLCINILERVILKNKFYMFSYYTFALALLTIGIGIYEKLNL